MNNLLLLFPPLYLTILYVIIIIMIILKMFKIKIFLNTFLMYIFMLKLQSGMIKSFSCITFRKIDAKRLMMISKVYRTNYFYRHWRLYNLTWLQADHQPPTSWKNVVVGMEIDCIYILLPSRYYAFIYKTLKKTPKVHQLFCSRRKFKYTLKAQYL